MRREGEFRVQIQNILPSIRPHAARRIDIPMAITTVGRENQIAVMITFSQQHRSERFPIEVLWRLAARDLKKSWEQVHPAYDGVGAFSCFHNSRPGEHEGHTNACIVKVPLGKGPLSAVIAAENNKNVLP